MLKRIRGFYISNLQKRFHCIMPNLLVDSHISENVDSVFRDGPGKFVLP